MDIHDMTRAQAERLVAGTTDIEMLKLLGDHKNKHVRAKAGRKFKALVPPPEVVGDAP